MQWHGGRPIANVSCLRNSHLPGSLGSRSQSYFMERPHFFRRGGWAWILFCMASFGSACRNAGINRLIIWNKWLVLSTKQPVNAIRQRANLVWWIFPVTLFIIQGLDLRALKVPFYSSMGLVVLITQSNWPFGLASCTHPSSVSIKSLWLGSKSQESH